MEQVRTVPVSVADLDAQIKAGSIVDPALMISRLMAGLKGYLPALT